MVEAAPTNLVPRGRPEREAADSGTRNNPGGYGQAEGMRGVIHIAPDAAASHTNRASRRVDMHVLRCREVVVRASSAWRLPRPPAL